MATAFITGYSFRLGSARAVKCCPPVMVKASGATSFAISRVLTTR